MCDETVLGALVRKNIDTPHNVLSYSSQSYNKSVAESLDLIRSNTMAGYVLRYYIAPFVELDQKFNVPTDEEKYA